MPFKFVPKQNMSPEETLNKISETLDNINQTLQQIQTNQQLTQPTQQIDWDKIQKSLENVSDKLNKIVNGGQLNKQFNNDKSQNVSISEQIVKERKESMFRDKLMKSLNTIGNILGSILKSFKPIQVLVNLFNNFSRIFSKLFGFLDKFIFKSKWFMWMFKTGHLLLSWLYQYIILSIFKGIISIGKFLTKPFVWLGRALTPLLGQLVKPLSWLFKPVIDLLKPVQSWITKSFKKVGSAITKPFKWVGSKVGGQFSNLFKRKKKPTIETVGEMVSGQQTGKAQTETQKGGFGEGFKSFQVGLQMLGTPQQLLGQVTIVILQIQLRIIRPIIETLIGKIADVIIEIVRAITDLTKSGFNTFIESLKIQQDLQKSGKETAQNFRIVAGGITELQLQFSGLFLALGASNVVNAISNFANAIALSIASKEAREYMMQNSPQYLLTQFFEKIILPFINVTKTIPPTQQQSIKIVSDSVVKIINSMIPLSVALRANQTLFGGIFNVIGSIVSSVFNKKGNQQQNTPLYLLKRFFDDIIVPLIKKMITNANTLKNQNNFKVISNAVVSILDTIPSLSKALENKKSSMFTGFINSIGNIVDGIDKQDTPLNLFKKFFDDIMTPLIEKMTQNSEKLNKQDNFKVISNAVVSILDTIPSLSKALDNNKDHFGILMKAFKIVSDNVSQQIQQQTQQTKPVDLLKTFFDSIMIPLIETMTTNSQKLQQQDKFRVVSSAVINIIDVIPQLSNALSPKQNFFISLIKAMGGIVSSTKQDTPLELIKQFFEQIIKPLIEESKTIDVKQQNSFEIVSNATANIMNSLPALETAISRSMGFWKNTGKNLTELFGLANKDDLFNNLKQLFTDVTTKLLPTIKNIQDSEIVKLDLFALTVDKIINILNKLSNINTNKISNALTNIIDNNFIIKFADNITIFYDKLTKNIPNILRQYTNFYQKVQEYVNGTLKNQTDATKQAIINSVTQIIPSSIPGFRYGGYTGDGRPDEIQGVVHKGEYVVPQQLVPKFKTEIEKIEKERQKLLGTRKYIASLLTLIRSNLKTTNIMGFDDGGFTGFKLVLSPVTQQTPVNINIAPNIKVPTGQESVTNSLISLLLDYIKKQKDNKNISPEITSKLTNVLSQLTTTILLGITGSNKLSQISNDISKTIEKSDTKLVDDNIKKVTDITFENIINVVTSVITNITDDLTTTIYFDVVSMKIDTNIIQQLSLQLSTLIIKVLSQISSTISNKQDVILNKDTIEKSTTDALQTTFTNVIQSILKSLTDNLFTKTIDNILQYFTGVQQQKTETQSNLSPETVKSINQNIDKLITQLQQDITTILQNTFTQISSMLTKVLQNVYNKISNKWFEKYVTFIVTTTLITELKDVITNSITNVVQKLVTSVTQTVENTVVGSIDTIIKQLSSLPILQQQLDKINKQLTSGGNINNDIKTQLEKEKKTLEDQIGSTPTDIKSVIDKVTTLKGTLTITISSMQGIIIDIVTFSLDTLNKYIFSNSVAKLITGSIAIVSLIPTVVKTLTENIPGTIENLVTSVISNISSNITKILSTQIGKLVDLQFQDLGKIVQDVFPNDNKTKKEKQNEEEQKPIIQSESIKESVTKLKDITINLISSTQITVIDTINSTLGTLDFIINNSVTKGLLKFVGSQQVVLSTIYVGLLTTMFLPKIMKFFTSTIPSILNDIIGYVTDILPQQFKNTISSLKSGKMETKSINVQEIVSTITKTVLDLTGKIINNQLDSSKYQSMVTSNNEFIKVIGSIMLFMTPILSIFAMTLINNLMTPITDMLTNVFKPENIQGIVENMSASDLNNIVTTVITAVFNIVTSVISGQFNLVTNAPTITSDPVTMYIMFALQATLMTEMIVLMGSIIANIHTILSSIGNLLNTMFNQETVQQVISETSSDKLYNLFQNVVTTTVNMVTSLTTKVFSSFFDDKTSDNLIDKLNPTNMFASVITNLGKFLIGGQFVISLIDVFKNIISQVGSLLNNLATKLDVSKLDIKLDTLVNTTVTTTFTVISNLLTRTFDYLTDERNTIKLPIFGGIQKQIITTFMLITANSLLEPLKSVLTSISNLFSNMFSETNIQNMVNKMSGTTVDTIITNIVGTTLSMLNNLIISATDTLTSLLSNTSSKGGIFGQLTSLVVDVMTGGLMTSFMKNTITNLSTIFNNITTLISNLMTKLSSDTTLSQYIEEKGTTVIDSIITETINVVFPTIQSIIDTALRRYQQQTNKGFFGKLLDKFLGFLFGSMGSSWDPMSELINTIITNIPTLFTKMSSFIDNLFTQLTDTNLLKDTLSKNTDLVKDIIKLIVDNIISITLKSTLPEIIKMGMEGKIRRQKKDVSFFEQFLSIFDNTVGTEDIFMEDIQKPLLEKIPTIFGYIQTQFNNILDPKNLNYSQILQDSETGKTVIVSLFNTVIDSIFKSFFNMVFDKDNLEKNMELFTVKKKTTQTFLFIPIGETIEESNIFTDLASNIFSKLPDLFTKVISGFDSLITQLVSSDTFKNIASDNNTIKDMTKSLFNSVLDMILKTVVGTLLTNAIEGKLNEIQKTTVTKQVVTTDVNGNTTTQNIVEEVANSVNPYIDNVFKPILNKLPQIFELIFGTETKPGTFDKILNSMNIETLVSNNTDLQTEFVKSIFNSTINMIFGDGKSQSLLSELIKYGITGKLKKVTTTTSGWWIFQKTETKVEDSFAENIQKPILEKLPILFKRIVGSGDPNNPGVFESILNNLKVSDILTQNKDKLLDDFLKPIFDKTVGLMFDVLSSLLNSNNIDKSLLTNINTVKSSLLTNFQTMGNAIGNIISSISNTISNMTLDTTHINNIISSLVPSISNTLNRMITIITNNGVLDAQINVNIVNGLWNVLEQFVDELSKHAPDIAGSLFGSLTFNFDYDEMKRKLTMTFTNVSEVTTKFEQQKVELMTEQNTYLSQMQSDVQEIKILLSEIKDILNNNTNNSSQQQTVYQSRDIINWVTSGLR